MAVIVNGDGILTGVSSLTTALDDITSGRGTITGVTTVGTLQLGAGVSISSPRSQQAAIFTNNTEFLTVDDAGRVGVGTVTPNSDVHPQNVGKINVGFITARSVAGNIDGSTLVVAGLSTFTDDVTFTGASANMTFDKSDNSLKVDDDFKIKVGDSGDLEIHHNGDNSVIADVGTGNLQLRAADFRVTNSDNTAFMIVANVGQSVQLYENNVKRFETSPSGVDVTGTINATGVSTFVGNVSIGATVAENRLDVAGDLKILDNSPRIFLHDTNAIGAVNATGGFETFDKDRNRAIYVGSINSSNNIEFGTTSTERMRIDADGRVLIGTDSTRQTRSGNSSYHPDVQLESAIAGLAIGKFNDSDGPARFVIQKARGSIASPAIVQDNDTIGQIVFSGWDGDTFTNSARITSEVDGTPGDDDMPGNLIFSTTADGASIPTERLRIDSSGRLLTGGATSSHGSTNADDLTIGASNQSNQTGITLGSASASGVRFADAGNDTAGAVAYYHNDDSMRFTAAGNERFRIKSAGNVEILDGNLIIGPAGPGIDFSAQTATSATGSSTSAEILDHYEEGTFTPTISDGSNNSTFGGITAATYTKIGNTVRASFRCVNAQTSSLTGTNTFYVKGLPFTTVNRNYSTAWLRAFSSAEWSALKCLIFAYIESNQIYFQGDDGASSGKTLEVRDLVNNQTDLFMTFVYETSQ